MIAEGISRKCERCERFAYFLTKRVTDQSGKEFRLRVCPFKNCSWQDIVPTDPAENLSTKKKKPTDDEENDNPSPDYSVDWTA